MERGNDRQPSQQFRYDAVSSNVLRHGFIYDFVKAVNKKVESGVFAPDDYDDSYEPVEEPPVYDYYLITSTSKQNQPGECGNKITGSVYLGRW